MFVCVRIEHSSPAFTLCFHSNNGNEWNSFSDHQKVILVSFTTVCAFVMVDMCAYDSYQSLFNWKCLSGWSEVDFGTGQSNSVWAGRGGCLFSHLEFSGSCDLEQQVHIWQRAVCFLPEQHSIFISIFPAPQQASAMVSGHASRPESSSPAISCASRMNGDIIPRQANEFHRKMIREVFSRTKSSLEIERGKKNKNHKRTFGCKHCSEAELGFFKLFLFSGEIFLEGMNTDSGLLIVP